MASTSLAARDAMTEGEQAQMLLNKMHPDGVRPLSSASFAN